MHVIYRAEDGAPVDEATKLAVEKAQASARRGDLITLAESNAILKRELARRKKIQGRA